MIKNDKIKIVTTFTISLLICLSVITTTIKHHIDAAYSQLDALTSEITQQIQEDVVLPINQIYTVESYIKKHNGDISDIDEFASVIVDHTHVRNLLLAPNGIVTHVFPDTADNHQVLGLNFYGDSVGGNTEAIDATQMRKLLLAGPYVTVVGDEAISGRLPVYLTDEDGEETFWGLLSITLIYPNVLSDVTFSALESRGLSYELWRINQDTLENQVILSGGPACEESRYYNKSFSILNAEWNLRIGPLAKWYEDDEILGYFVFSLVISALLAFLVHKNQYLNHTQKTYEDMLHHDQLTRILNRQGLYKEFDQLLLQEERFSIYFMDLDAFKHINDHYGHAAGDTILITFAERISRVLNKNHVFARISGDEFILVYRLKHATDAEISAFWDAVDVALEKPIVVNEQPIFISFSKGMAIFPDEGQTVDDVLMLADDRMYQTKKR